MSEDPLDIALPPTPELLLKVKNYLASENIGHEPLTLLADTTQNLAITDKEKVFVKVYRRKDGLKESVYTELAKSLGADTLECLAYNDWCSVWRYETLEPLPLAHLKEALAPVRHLHQATLGQAWIDEMLFEDALKVILGRLTKVRKNKMKDFIANEATLLCDLIANESRGRAKSFIHADLQIKNMGLSPRLGPIVFDWEICKMAPIELELSKLEENLYTMDSWTPGKTERLYGAPLDKEFLRLATRLRYIQNMAFHLERNELLMLKKQAVAYRNYLQEL